MKNLTNKIVCGDSLDKLLYVNSETIDLIYLDPPFFSKKDYEIIWGNGAELKAFGDRWQGGIKHYIEWMRPRLEQCHRVLKETGSIYLHCDKHAVHYLKVMMDNVFGRKNFRNEIIWAYRTGGASKKHWSRKHDNILFYTKSKEWTFNLIKEKIYYDKPFFGDKGTGEGYHKDKDGKIYTYVHPVDVWNIKAVLNLSKERIGYPTQKPEALLEKIIRASSNEGDIVLDPFVGGGTTVTVARRLKRNWIGIDVSPVACVTSYERLYGKQNVNKLLTDIIDYPATPEELEKLDGFQFQQWVTTQLNAICNPNLSGDGGIDGKFIDGTPLEVKKGQLSRGHVQKFHSAIRTARRKKGVMIGRSIPRTVYEKVAEIKRQEGIEIVVLTTKKVIEGDFREIRKAKIKMRPGALMDFVWSDKE